MNEAQGVQQCADDELPPDHLPPPGFQQNPVTIQSTGAQMLRALGVKTTKILSIALIIYGVIATILQIICAIMVGNTSTKYPFHDWKDALWFAALGSGIMLSGIVGLFAASKRTNCLVQFFWGMNLSCAFTFSPILIIQGVLNSMDYGHWTFRFYEPDDVVFALTIITVIDAVLVFGLSIWYFATNYFAVRKIIAVNRRACCCQESPSQPPVAPAVAGNAVDPNQTVSPSQIEMHRRM